MMRLRDVTYCAHDGGAIVFARNLEGRVGVIFSNQRTFSTLSIRQGSTAEIARIYGWIPVTRCKYLRVMRKIGGIVPQIEVVK